MMGEIFSRIRVSMADLSVNIDLTKMPRMLLLAVAAASMAVLAIASPLKDDPYTPTDASTEERSNSIFTTLSDDGPMAGMGGRRLEPFPTPNPEERSSESIYTTLSDDGPMAGMGNRKLRQ
ncbi:hypothetical protein BBJ29_005164 [Phytophthora kernoviae]|uniref:Uncharacterized protein n=1 Tax=Phytophthora kernoviae TaxID=325452 RepID=A0A3F2RM63_9STRA|nr:hypothetical protein BBJ29_005164 [Phytophthora kernoviae]RLN60334.1 hypothetical protein BBP00_00006045 [Phytophthora kernoviae]